VAHTPERPITGSAEVAIDLEIENTYADGCQTTTHVTRAVVRAPPSNADEDAMADWAYDQLFPFTGTGRTEGEAWYDVLITASDDASLVGKIFQFGY
jgi:hypothetical protein